MVQPHSNTEIDKDFYEALALFQNGEVERAEDLCFEILKNTPHHGNTLNLLGAISLKEKAFETAKDLFQQAMAYYPQKAPIFAYNLALTYAYMGNPLAAAMVYKNAADTFLERNEIQEVLTCLEKGAILLKEYGYFNEAKQFYANLIEINPQMITAHNDLGLIFYLEGNYEQAANYFKYIIESVPTYSNAYNNLGLVLLAQKKIKESLPFFEKSLELDPLCVESHLNFGTGHLEQGNLEEAMNQFQKALKIDSLHAGAHNNVGIVLYQQGKLQEAILSFQQALKLAPSYTAAQKHLDLALQDLENQNWFLNKREL